MVIRAEEVIDMSAPVLEPAAQAVADASSQPPFLYPLGSSTSLMEGSRS
jgi:hypothetical protein